MQHTGCFEADRLFCRQSTTGGNIEDNNLFSVYRDII